MLYICHIVCMCVKYIYITFCLHAGYPVVVKGAELLSAEVVGLTAVVGRVVSATSHYALRVSPLLHRDRRTVQVSQLPQSTQYVYP